VDTLSASPVEIAEWMMEEFNKRGRLVQTYAVWQIKKRFGEEHIYKNKNHNWAINQPILEAFRTLTPDNVVWSRSRQLWRTRRDSDPPDARMVK